MSTREATRSGWVAAIRADMAPPSETPIRWARSTPASSMTARTSSIRSSKVPRPNGRSERPVPRLSNTIRRL